MIGHSDTMFQYFLLQEGAPLDVIRGQPFGQPFYVVGIWSYNVKKKKMNSISIYLNVEIKSVNLADQATLQNEWYKLEMCTCPNMYESAACGGDVDSTDVTFLWFSSNISPFCVMSLIAGMWNQSILVTVVRCWPLSNVTLKLKL